MEPEGKRKRKSRFFWGLLIGLLLGWLGSSLAPRSWQAYIPDAIRPGRPVDGEVVEKSSEAERLLLKLVTEQGLILATFSERQDEIDLLVEKGDTVTIRVQRYEPFLEDPPIERVRRPGSSATPETSSSPSQVSGSESEPMSEEELPEPEKDLPLDETTTSVTGDEEPP